MQPQKLCLKWNNHTTNLLAVLGSFQQKDILVDVTISCEGQNIKAHKMVLSACSPYFQNIFLENPCKHPVIIINGIKYEDITAILNFMYKGEVNVSQDGLSSFLQAAEALKVKGLAEVCGEKKSTNSMNQEVQQSEQNRPQRTDTPPRKRHRNRKRSLSDSNRSDDEGTARKHREHSSPEIHELSGDESFTGDNTSNGPPFNSLPRVPQNVYSRSHQSSSNLGGEDDEDFEVEPSKLLEQTLTTENVSMNNSSNSDNNLRIERIMGNATEMESSSMQEPESPPDIKPVIDYGESGAGTSEGNLMLYSDQSQPGPSSVQDSLLHDSSHTQGGGGKKPWPQDFKISFHRASSELVQHMMLGISHLNWQTRHELLSIIAADIAQYTVHPDMTQRKQVAAELIKHFPSLQSGVDVGLSGWAERIYAKMKDYRLKQETEESKAVRKNKKNTSSCIKVPHRGETNFLPSPIVSSEEQQLMVSWMKEESKKPLEEQDRQKIMKCLEATFPVRRKMLTNNVMPLKDVKESYPALFTVEGLYAEFKNLQDIDIHNLIVNFKECAFKIISEAEKKHQKATNFDEAFMTPLRWKRKIALQLKEKIFSYYKSISDNDMLHTVLCAFLLLPLVLNEEANDMYRIINSGCPIENVAGETSDPVIVFVGNPFDSKEIYICGDNVILVQDVSEAVTAMMVLFCLYYVCNVPYPATCNSSFLFLQNYLLKIHYGRKLPSKMIKLIEKF